LPTQFPFLNDPFFRQLFGDRSNFESRRRPVLTERALGSGVIVSDDGHILTNHHVIDGADQITVELSDRRTFSAKLIGSDAPSDLAVLKVSASHLPVLALGDSDKVRVGDVCLAVGNPFGLGETVTAGIISAKKRSTGVSDEVSRTSCKRTPRSTMATPAALWSIPFPSSLGLTVRFFPLRVATSGSASQFPPTWRGRWRNSWCAPEASSAECWVWVFNPSLPNSRRP